VPFLDAAGCEMLVQVIIIMWVFKRVKDVDNTVPFFLSVIIIYALYNVLGFSAVVDGDSSSTPSTIRSSFTVFGLSTVVDGDSAFTPSSSITNR
jgi:ABC-type iron transport system FetAB permease component